ncbi:MAG: oligosaccharide flippase family protein [Bacteroides sp.]|nr:oligosaccharide flippase family protein [Eubacterium sp.]MCM1419060.1 oligosaccharide flippase family protein [Roseburia sp.]MCM1461753.1 oligosaccharide flippase family protein [Bacteroides sp.]
MNNSSKSILKNILFSFSANFISLILGVIATFFFPKFLGVAEFGYYQLYIFYTGYLVITALGFADGVQLKIAGKKYGELDFNEQNSLFWFSTLTQVFLYAVLMIAVFILIDDANKRFVLIADCVVGLIAHSRYYLYTILQGVNRLKEYSHIIITERSISIVISIIALIMGFKDFRLMIVFDVIGRIISFVIAVNFCREIVFKKPHMPSGLIKSVLKYVSSGSMILFAVQTSSIVIGINRFGIERKWGIEEFSRISLAIALANMVLRCVNSISVVMFPTLRNVETKKLPTIYKNINVALMSLIFVMMCFFKPMCYVIGLWLPQYADSLKYSVLLLPVCVYECKYSLLINTNLKNLNKEKTIGLINGAAVIASFVLAFISIFCLKNVELAVIGILIALSVRSIIGEIVIGKIFHIKVVSNIVYEFILSIVFIIANYYCPNWAFGFIYVFFVAIYIFIERKEIGSLFKKIRIRPTPAPSPKNNK